MWNRGLCFSLRRIITEDYKNNNIIDADNAKKIQNILYKDDRGFILNSAAYNVEDDTIILMSKVLRDVG